MPTLSREELADEMNKYFDYVPNFGGQAEKINLFLPKIYELQSMENIKQFLNVDNSNQKQQ